MPDSPALDVIRLLQRRGAAVSYHDPHVPKLRDEAIDLASVSLTPETVSTADCVVIVTDHSDVDYALVERCARLVVDTRNALATVRQRRHARRRAPSWARGSSGSSRRRVGAQ